MDNGRWWTGYAISALVSVILLADAGIALLSPATLSSRLAETGFPGAMIAPVGWLALLSGLLCALPRTATLGAIMTTGFAGGAMATHLRLGHLVAPPQLFCAALAVMAWAGPWLRDPRVRAILPIGMASSRRQDSGDGDCSRPTSAS